jgi:hypothetical protein
VWHRHQNSVEISDCFETSEDDSEFLRGYMQRSAQRIMPLFGEEAIEQLGGADRANRVSDENQEARGTSYDELFHNGPIFAARHCGRRRFDVSSGGRSSVRGGI